MKDIKIRVTENAYNLAVIDHAIHLGYKADETTAHYLLDADYFLVREHQSIAWCESGEFRNDLSEEMTDIEFLKYEGGE